MSPFWAWPWLRLLRPLQGVELLRQRVDVQQDERISGEDLEEKEKVGGGPGGGGLGFGPLDL